jgi:[ribosomal protein S18]-alanine N-acetyltransferase
MPAEIRLARASDVDALAALEKSAFDADRISKTSFRRMVASGSATILVATGEGAVEGYCAVLFRAGSRKARLYSIAVRPGNGGIGRALLAAAENAAAARGSGQMRLEVREDNSRAIALYEKSGYRPFGRKPDYYADGATALRYSKPLAPAQADAAAANPGMLSR